MICARDAHVSTHTALMLTGARPGVGGAGAGRRLGRGHGASRPTRSPPRWTRTRTRSSSSSSRRPTPASAPTCRGWSGVAHRRGVPLVVDEAWGPHLRFGAAAGLPVDALTAGADAVDHLDAQDALEPVAELGAAWSAAGRIPVDRVAAAVRMTQTTSPYLPLVASVDSCRAQLEDDGPALVGWAVDLARLARTLLARVPGPAASSRPRTSALDGRLPSYGGLDPVQDRGRRPRPWRGRGRAPTGRCARRTASPSRAPTRAGSTSSSAPATRVASVRRLVLALAALGSPGAAPRSAPPPLPAIPEQAVSPARRLLRRAGAGAARRGRREGVRRARHAVPARHPAARARRGRHGRGGPVAADGRTGRSPRARPRRPDDGHLAGAQGPLSGAALRAHQGAGRIGRLQKSISCRARMPTALYRAGAPVEFSESTPELHADPTAGVRLGERGLQEEPGDATSPVLLEDAEGADVAPVQLGEVVVPEADARGGRRRPRRSATGSGRRSCSGTSAMSWS